MSELWQPPDEDERAFLALCRRWALPVAGGLGFVLLAVFLWSVSKLTELVLAVWG